MAPPARHCGGSYLQFNGHAPLRWYRPVRRPLIWKLFLVLCVSIWLVLGQSTLLSRQLSTTKNITVGIRRGVQRGLCSRRASSSVRFSPTKLDGTTSLDIARSLDQSRDVSARASEKEQMWWATVNEFMNHVSMNELERVENMLNNGIPVNIADHDNRTALHAAVAGGHLPMARMLLDRGADPSMQDRWGKTAGDEAQGKSDFCEILESCEVGEAELFQPNFEDDLMGSQTKACLMGKIQPTSVIVLGASGDLATKKTFPALFSLFHHKLLPAQFNIVGFARKGLTKEDFHERVRKHIKKPKALSNGEFERELKDFLARCSYQQGSYDSAESFLKLDQYLVDSFERLHPCHSRVFYLAVPPSVFIDSVRSITSIPKKGNTGFARVIVEKPFGRDSESYEELARELSSMLDEESLYRIDHYLGKELVQNIMTLRFANRIFEPLWNNLHIEKIEIEFKENFGVDGRLGFFDENGIVRDIMQNHLLQVASLVLMEHPVTLSADDIRDEKVKAVRSLEQITKENIVLGQYIGYQDHEGVTPNSRTPTFAEIELKSRNPRFEGVPIVMRAGKALDERKAEVRVKFKKGMGSLFKGAQVSENELVIRVQPDEAVYMNIISKVPGLTSRLTNSRLNLLYKDAFAEGEEDKGGVWIPEAYERLILDAINGDKALFIRGDELKAAWELFTPVLHAAEQTNDIPVYPYEQGSQGPLVESQYLKPAESSSSRPVTVTILGGSPAESHTTPEEGASPARRFRDHTQFVGEYDEIVEEVRRIISESETAALSLDRPKKQFSVAIAGGSVPKVVGEALKTDGFSFKSWDVFLADERCVPKDHEDSNYGSLRSNLHPSIKIHEVDGVGDACERQSAEGYSTLPCPYHLRYGGLVRDVLQEEDKNGTPIFDLIILGMGPDGHVASLFPGHELLNERSKIVDMVNDSPKPPSERVTLTLPVLRAARRVIVVAQGDAKSQAIAQVLAPDNDATDPLPAELAGVTDWIMDAAAASKILGMSSRSGKHRTT